MAFDKHYPLWMQAKPSGGGDAAPDGVAEALASGIAAQLGHQVSFVDAPTLCDSSFGPGSVGFSLDSTGLPTEWMGRLVAFPLGAESAVLEAAPLLPCHVAALVTGALVVSADLGGVWAVAEVPGGRDFVEAIGTEPETATPRLREMAALHAKVHQVNPAKVVGVPALDFHEVLGSLPTDMATERSWLSANHPGPGAQALCHGGLSPLVVRISSASSDPLTFRNWSAAVVAEPEYDLAWTLQSFWLAPLFAATRSERRGMLMIRDGLANLYRTAYKSVAPVNADRLKYWQAYHAAIGFAEDRANPGHLPAEVGPSLRKRFAKLAK